MAKSSLLIRGLVLAAALAVLGLVWVVPAHSQDASVDLRFDRAPLYDVARVVLGQVLHESYYFDQAFAESSKPVTLDLRGFGPNGLRTVFDAVLASYGFEAVRSGGVTRIGVRHAGLDADELFTYRPLERSVGYLTNALRPFVLKGRFGGVTGGTGLANFAPNGAQAAGAAPAQASGGSANGGAVVGGGASGGAGISAVVPAAGAVTGLPDVLLFVGPKDEVERVKSLLPVLDVPAGEVLVYATVYEVDRNESDSSAVDLALSILGGRFGVAVGTVATGSTFNVSLPIFQAGLNALSQDGRFHQVSTSTLRVRSGESARVVVGSDVPILGGVVLAGNGVTSQSVQYQSSGVILNLSALVLRNTVQLSIGQELSGFVATDTGVNSSPTLQKRAVTTSVDARSGEVLVLGGLNDSQLSGSKSGPFFLPAFLRRSSAASKNVEVVVVLRVEVVGGDKS